MDSNPTVLMLTFSSFTNLGGLNANSAPGAPCGILLTPPTLNIVGAETRCFWATKAVLVVLTARPPNAPLLSGGEEIEVLGAVIARADAATLAGPMYDRAPCCVLLCRLLYVVRS